MKAAGVITVNSLGTAVNPGDGQCTLIEAIRSANADASSGAGFNECPGGSGTDTILVPAGVITLTGVNTIHFGLAVGLPAITTPLTIRGSGAGATIIERSTGAPDFGLIVASAALTVSDVTLRNGRSSAGGAI